MVALTLSSCALGLRPARRRRGWPVRAVSEGAGGPEQTAAARLLRLGVFDTAERADDAVAAYPELEEVSERSLARRLVTLRRCLPSTCDVKAMVEAEPSVLCTEEGVPVDLADDLHEARLRGCLDELSFLPEPVLAVLVSEDPLLLVFVGLLRQGDLLSRWERSSLALKSEEERKVEYAKDRFSSYVRNYIC